MNKKESLIDSGLATTFAAGNQGTTQNAVLDQLQAILLKKLAKEQEQEEAEEEIKRKAREQGARALQQRRDDELLKQSSCTHMKPWGGPSIGGQRDHANHYHWLCLFCSKEWTDGELPGHLRISSDKVGGPIPG